MELLHTLYPEWLRANNRKSVLDSLGSSLTEISFDSLPEDPQSDEDVLRVMASLPKNPVPHRPNQPVAVILAGGKGSRMGASVKQKSLCPIHGRPALLWAMDTYREFGIEHFIIVTGVGYQDVLQALGCGNPNVTFLYQEKRLGTGHAARLAARYLRHMKYEGHVLAAMGDKFITRRGIQELLSVSEQTQADLILATAAKTAWPDAGRVVLDREGRVCAIAERPDIVQRQLISDFYAWETDPVSCPAFQRHALNCWNRPEKLRKILDEKFWDILSSSESLFKKDARFPLRQSQLEFKISETLRFTAEDIESQCNQVNISVYIFHANALYDATERLGSDNAQKELYLTDAVYDLTSNHHSEPYHVTAAHMPGDYDVMGFNTLEELAEIERRVKKYSKI